MGFLNTVWYLHLFWCLISFYLLILFFFFLETVDLGLSSENSLVSGRSGPRYNMPAHVAVQMTAEQVSFLLFVHFYLESRSHVDLPQNHFCLS